MYKYSPEGSYQSEGSFDLSSDNTNPIAIAYYDDALWVVDSTDNRVYKYSPDGTQSSGSFNLSGDNTEPRGIAYYDNALWVTDSDDNKVYRYSPGGDPQSSFNLTRDNDNAMA